MSSLLKVFIVVQYVCLIIVGYCLLKGFHSFYTKVEEVLFFSCACLFYFLEWTKKRVMR